MLFCGYCHVRHDHQLIGRQGFIDQIEAGTAERGGHDAAYSYDSLTVDLAERYTGGRPALFSVTKGEHHVPGSL